METAYNTDFYTAQSSGSQEAARVVAPILSQLYMPKSVVDVGCGLGLWLREFAALGVTDYLGIDGPFIAPSERVIGRDSFLSHDLTRPLVLNRRFDLATCMEVAEHLPIDAAGQLVKTLTKLSDTVAFSAAIPWQGGTHHVNEQWPSWWAEKFAEQGYETVDTRVRHILWSDVISDPWYVQNLIVFKRGQSMTTLLAPLDVVHPLTYSRLADPRNLAVKKSAATLTAAIARKVRRRG